MAGMQAVYYRAADGSEPVDAFIGALREPPGRFYMLTNSGKMRSTTEARDGQRVAEAKCVSAVGSTAAEGAGRRARRSPGYREANVRLAPYEQLTRIVIRRRMELGLTQEQLAKRMGTSHSAISRIEGGQHSTSVQTLQRLAGALEMRFVMGFEHGPADKPVRELVPA